MRLRNTLTAILVLSGSLILVGCDQSGSNSGDVTATKASATKQVADAGDQASENATASKLALADTPSPKAPDSQAKKTKLNSKTNTNSISVNKKSKTAALSDPASVKQLKPTTPPVNPNIGELTIRAEPESLDLGEIATGDSKTGIINLVNFGSTPVKIIDCKSSCGCTAAKCPRNKVIEPGQSVEVEIKMSAANKPQKTTKVMRFMIEGQPQLAISVSSESVSYVLAEPWTIDRDKDEAANVEFGLVTLSAKDEKPFRILRMHPPILEEFSKEAAKSHELKLDWKRWEELGSTRRLTFYTDHPECDKLFVGVQAIYKPADRVTKQKQEKLRINKDDLQPRPANKGGVIQPVDGKTFVPPTPDYMNPVSNPINLIKAGKTEELLSLIENGDIDLENQDRTGATLLAVAAHNGKLEIVEELVALGADVEARDRIGKTPLMWAGHAKDANVIRAMLDAGADIRTRDTVVGTALSWTAGFGNGESVRELIKAGSDVNVSGTMGFTPLIWAALTGEADSVTALLEAGADAEVKDLTPAGSTPLMHASQTGNAKNVQALLDFGVKIDITDREGKTALLIAAEKSGGDVKTIKTLIKAGADITATDLRGRNALDLANNRTDPRSADVIQYLESIIAKQDKPQPKSGE